MAGRPREARRKITSWAALARVVRQAGRRRRTVVFTNGCFDLLHAGHLTLLQQARRQGDLLIVGINSDASVQALKGAHRPILPQRDRALLLAGLECVDYVTVFSERTPQRLIERVRPHVLVKGADWVAGQVVGREVVQRNGGRVVRIPLRKGCSTTRLIARIRRPRHRATASGRGPVGFAAAGRWAGCRPTRGVIVGATGSARGAPHGTPQR